MASFEKFYARSRDEIRNDRTIKNALYELKAKTREQNRRKRKIKQNILIAMLVIVDLILLFMLVQKRTKEKELDELTWQESIKTQVISVEVPCPTATPINFYDDYKQSAIFTVTHYCGCEKCCGKWSGGSESEAYGALGRKLKPYQSVAVDKDIIPLGTILNSSEGIQFIAEDTGSGVKGYHIDLFVGDHEEALKLGVKKIELFW